MQMCMFACVNPYMPVCVPVYMCACPSMLTQCLHVSTNVCLFVHVYMCVYACTCQKWCHLYTLHFQEPPVTCSGTVGKMPAWALVLEAWGHFGHHKLSLGLAGKSVSNQVAFINVTSLNLPFSALSWCCSMRLVCKGWGRCYDFHLMKHRQEKKRKLLEKSIPGIPEDISGWENNLQRQITKTKSRTSPYLHTPHNDKQNMLRSLSVLDSSADFCLKARASHHFRAEMAQ